MMDNEDLVIVVDVLHVISSTNQRGAERFAVDLQAALSARGRESATVALAPGAGEGAMPIETLGRWSLGPGTIRELRRRMRAATLTIAHGSRTLPACAVASSSRGAFAYRSIGDASYWSASGLRRARVTQALRRAVAVVALWPMARDMLMQIHGVPAERLHVIPNGVPAARFPAIDAVTRARARATLGLDNGAPVLLFLGALSEEKNPARAIRAAAAIRDAYLLVAGDGPERSDLQLLAAECAPGRVRFLGAVDNPATVLSAADLLVLSSRTEGMPAVVIEAGMMGLPVVATDVGAVNDIVVHGETGYVVESSDDALSQGLREALASPNLGFAAREHCLVHFEIGVVAQAWDELIRQLTS